MNHIEAFSLLGIPVSKDPSAVKQAYQAQIPHHHPEEDPQGFMQLHQAYKTALAYAQEKHLTQSAFAEPLWHPQNTHSAGEEMGYDSLFASLEETERTDVEQLKGAFSRKLRRLSLHWLPIPLKSWRQFFGSEIFQLCRREPECLEKLFELLLRKIHSYGVFCYLINRLWELDIWQTSESMEDAAGKTRACIDQLHEQYSHYLKLGSASRASQPVLRALWYYQAMPFYFKLIPSIFFISLFSCGSVGLFDLLFLTFYTLEICTLIRKRNRSLGYFHSSRRKYDGLLIVVTIYALVIHFACCIGLFGVIFG